MYKRTCYAIRQEGTNNYFPAKQHQTGNTWDEPVEDGGPNGPRLFTSYAGACNALAWWKKGARSFRPIYDPLSGECMRYAPEVQHLPEREAIEFEIVTLLITEQRAD